MKVYLINKNTNEVIREFSNVLSFNSNYVEYSNGNCRGKIYCDIDVEYVTNINPEQDTQLI